MWLLSPLGGGILSVLNLGNFLVPSQFLWFLNVYECSCVWKMFPSCHPLCLTLTILLPTCPESSLSLEVRVKLKKNVIGAKYANVSHSSHFQLWVSVLVHKYSKNLLWKDNGLIYKYHNIKRHFASLCLQQINGRKFLTI